jgi:hypothetical protein
MLENGDKGEDITSRIDGCSLDMAWLSTFKIVKKINVGL